MMKETVMNIRTLIAVVALAATGAAFAQAPAPKDPTAMPKAEKRQAEQEKRIQQGVASGQLTPKEAARLEKREAKVNADMAAAKADGKVTKTERRKIQAEQNANSKAIAHQKRDKQKVAPAAKPAN
jgi:uncharacterized membrane protein YebE (DUF533 family)